MYLKAVQERLEDEKVTQAVDRARAEDAAKAAAPGGSWLRKILTSWFR
jgi:hypothetical protein